MKLAAAIYLLACASGLAAPAAPVVSPAPPPPNIIFIFADDIGVDWVSCYGADQPTPNLDRLAARSVRFTNAWTAPICTPSRVMMLTGQYPGRTGWTEHYDVPRWGGAGLIPEKFPTWPQLLHARGYATAIVGKWQINDLRLQPDILVRHGFDGHCVWPGVERDNPPSEHRYWDPFLQTDGVRETHVNGYGPDITQTYAIDFLRRNRDRPFMLYYPAIAVHAPNEAIPSDRLNPPKGEAALYARAVTYLDRQVGELLDELDRLHLSENTVVIFAGDNGSSTGGRMHGVPVPSGKGSTAERGVHVPLMVCAPMLGRSGRTTAALADISDLFPTMLQLAGIPLPADARLDGRSWVPLLRGDADYQPRPWIFAQRDTSRTVSDGRFKLDSEGGFFETAVDPDQHSPVSPQRDAATAAAYARLAAALASVPAAGAPPFPGYTPERMRAYSAAHP